MWSNGNSILEVVKSSKLTVPSYGFIVTSDTWLNIILFPSTLVGAVVIKFVILHSWNLAYNLASHTCGIKLVTAIVIHLNSLSYPFLF